MDTPQEESLTRVTSLFDAIRHLDGERELYEFLGYNSWENFEHVIVKAKIACKYNLLRKVSGSLSKRNTRGFSMRGNQSFLIFH